MPPPPATIPKKVLRFSSLISEQTYSPLAKPIVLWTSGLLALWHSGLKIVLWHSGLKSSGSPVFIYSLLLLKLLGQFLSHISKRPQRISRSTFSLIDKRLSLLLSLLS